MKQNEICWESGLNYVVSNPTCLPIQRIEIGILHKVSLYAQASQNKLWGKTRTLKFSSRNYLVQNKAPFGYSWKRRRILWTLYLKFKSFLINKQVKTKSAICTLFKICQSAWCLAWDISLLSRYFYLSFLYTSPSSSWTTIWWPHNTGSRTAAQRSFNPWRLLWGWRTF